MTPSFPELSTLQSTTAHIGEIHTDESRAREILGAKALSPNQILRPPDAAGYLGLTTGSLAKSRLYGWGPNFVRLGARAVGYRVTDLDAWTASRVCRSTSEKGAA